MGVNPQQLATMQSQLASMGMGGIMGGMGAMGAMGGMGGSMYTSYSPEQMPHVFLKLSPNQGRQEISPSTAQIGQSKYKGSMGAGAWRSEASRPKASASQPWAPARPE